MRLPRDVRAIVLAAAGVARHDRVEVPVPPSANNLFPTRKGSSRRFKSPGYKAWQAAAHPVLETLRRPAAFPVEVWLTLAGSGVNGRRDLANVEKAVVDGLVATGVLPDDCLTYVVGIHLVYRPDGGEQRVAVEFAKGGGA